MKKLYTNRRKRDMTCYIIGNENGDRTRTIKQHDKFWIDDEEPLGPQHNHRSRVIGYYIQNGLPIKATFSKYAVKNYCTEITE